MLFVDLIRLIRSIRGHGIPLINVMPMASKHLMDTLTSELITRLHGESHAYSN
jgi:hypothetical protein